MDILKRIEVFSNCLKKTSTWAMEHVYILWSKTETLSLTFSVFPAEYIVSHSFFLLLKLVYDIGLHKRLMVMRITPIHILVCTVA